MDDSQRISDQEDILEAYAESRARRVFTSLPGFIVEFDPETVMATVQIGIQRPFTDDKGIRREVDYPLLTDVPVIFPRGGNVTLTFPVQEDDECWIMFSARGMDGWKEAGGVQPAGARRCHHLSDAVCYLGPMSQAKRIKDISTTTTQLRSNDGKTLIELDPKAQVVNINAPGGLTITAPTVRFTGQVTVDDDVKAGSISLKEHVHAGVQAGESKTGQPE
jgi:hypothetical protein